MGGASGVVSVDGVVLLLERPEHAKGERAVGVFFFVLSYVCLSLHVKLNQVHSAVFPRLVRTARWTACCYSECV